MAWEELVATFKDGDVLYGLDAGRKAAKEAILRAQPKTKIKATFLCCLVRTKKVDRIVIQNAITDSVFDAIGAGQKLKTGGQIFSTDKQILANKGVKADPERAIGFRDHLKNHPKWNLEKGISDDAVKGAGWKANKPPDAPVSDMDRARKAWTRTSKAGLEYHTKVRGCTVHFILDGLDFDRVVKKIPGDVTSAEIRWLYRNRGNRQVMDHVCFWLDGKVMDPPWDWPKNRTAFATYKPKSEQEIASDNDEARPLQDTIEQTKFSSIMAFWKAKEQTT